MKTRTLLYFLCLLPLLAGAAASAQESSGPAALNFTGYYALSWKGIPLGSIVMEMREQPGGGYSIRARSESLGLAELFSEHRGLTVSQGRKDDSGYLPALYETRYKSRGKKIHIKLDFDGRRGIVAELVEPPINHAARPEVPAEMKKNVFDILSGFLQLRHMLYDASLAGQRSFDFDVFDGNRLSRIHATLAEELMLKMHGDLRPAVRVEVRREPLAGYKEKELREVARGEPPLHLYFSRDDRMIPLKGAINVFYGKLEGILIAECPSLESCGQTP